MNGVVMQSDACRGYYAQNRNYIFKNTEFNAEDKVSNLNQDTVSFTNKKTTVDNRSDNDGDILFKDKAKNFCKGIIKPVATIFESPKNFLIGAATIAAGAGLIAITGGAIAPVMITAGVIGGGMQFTKGVIKASKAKTDAEAEAAWQDIGAGTFAIGSSILGAKSSLKVAGYADDVANMNALQATGKCFTTAPKQLSASWTNATSKISTFIAGIDDATNLTDDVITQTNDASTQIDSTSFKPNDISSQMDDIQAQAEARIEAEALAKENAKIAQEKYNKSFDDALSNKSARDSAEVFNKEYDMQIKNEAARRTDLEGKIKAAQDYQDAQIRDMQNPSGMTTAEKQELVSSLEKRLAQQDKINLKHQNADKALDIVKQNYQKAQELKIQYDANPSEELANEILKLVEPNARDGIFKALNTSPSWGDTNGVRKATMSEITDFWNNFRNSLYESEGLTTSEGLSILGFGRGIEGGWMG